MAGYEASGYVMTLDDLRRVLDLCEPLRGATIISGNPIRGHYDPVRGQYDIFTPQCNTAMLKCLTENLPPAVKGLDGVLCEVPRGSEEARSPEAEELKLIRVINNYLYFASLYPSQTAQKRLGEKFGNGYSQHMVVNPDVQRDAVREQRTFLEG